MLFPFHVPPGRRPFEICAKVGTEICAKIGNEFICGIENIQDYVLFPRAAAQAAF
jgi:hypothetical protein